MNDSYGNEGKKKKKKNEEERIRVIRYRKEETCVKEREKALNTFNGGRA